MYADDDSSRLDRGAFRRRTSLPLLLLLFAGGYGLLVAALRLSPSFAALFPAQTTQGGLPFLVQLALAFSGLAALILVLARAVRGIDTRPYESIAPVLAVFAGLVHLGLRVDLPVSGISSAYLAGSVIALALLGGALIAHGRLSAQLLGWVLVVAPCALVALMLLQSSGGDISFARLQTLPPALRVFLELLAASALLLGLAGAVGRRLGRGGREHEFGFSELDADAAHLAGAGGGRKLLHAIQMGAALLMVAGAAYWAVDRLKRSGDAPQLGATAAAGVAAPGLPVIEQLGAANAASAAQDKRPRAGKRAREAEAEAQVPHAPVQVPHAPAQVPHAPAQVEARIAKSAAAQPLARAPAAERTSRGRTKHASAPAPAPSKPAAPATSKQAAVQSKAAQTGRPAQHAALPAWGAEATREFAASKGAAKPEPDAKRAAGAARDMPAAPAAMEKASAPAGNAPAAVATPSAASLRTKAAIPPAPPPAPAKPEKPMTMDQLLDKVVDVTRKTQPQKGGSSAPKKQGDIDIDDLLNAAVTPKKGK